MFMNKDRRKWFRENEKRKPKGTTNKTENAVTVITSLRNSFGQKERAATHSPRNVFDKEQAE